MARGEEVANGRSARSLRLSWGVRALHPSAGGSRGMCIYTPLHPGRGAEGEEVASGTALAAAAIRTEAEEVALISSG